MSWFALALAFGANWALRYPLTSLLRMGYSVCELPAFLCCLVLEPCQGLRLDGLSLELMFGF
eukprot:8701090-Prorocentrum_lima.AAC.1